MPRCELANASPVSSFPRKRESIVDTAKVDPRLRGDDEFRIGSLPSLFWTSRGDAPHFRHFDEVLLMPARLISWLLMAPGLLWLTVLMIVPCLLIFVLIFFERGTYGGIDWSVATLGKFYPRL